MQGDVDICTKEDDIIIKYGLFDLRPERECARTTVKYILTDIGDIKQSYIRLGFHLKELDNMKYYEDFGYTNLAEFCEINLGMDKSAVSRCINVFENFSMLNRPGGVHTMHIDSRWKDFSYSQLCEMLPLNDEQRRCVKPSMTIKEIREMKKKTVATSQPTEKEFDSFDLMLDVVEVLKKKYGAAQISHSSRFINFNIGDSVYKFDLLLMDSK